MSGFDETVVSRLRWIGSVSAPIVAAAITEALLPRNSAAEIVSDKEEDGTRVYNVRDHGAKGDGTWLDTAAI